MNRRIFLAAVSSFAASHGLPACGSESAVQSQQKPSQTHAIDAPNILIFMPDQQNGATVLDRSPVVKPRLDRFRKESVTFTQAHCPAPHCCPSRASFMSGRYPSEHGVFNNVSTNTAIHENPNPGTPFWPRYLKQAGYSTGYAGKLHIGRDVTPETCGFETLTSLEESSYKSKSADREKSLQQARAHAHRTGPRRPGEILRPGWPDLQLYRTLPDSGSTGYEGLADTKVVRAAITGMERMAKGGKPWCIMVSNSGAHDTYDAPKRFVNLYDEAAITLPLSYADTLDDKPRVYQRQRYEYWSQLSEHETKQALIHYYAKCSMQDALFGELLDALEKTGQAENTIVIYTSDHGDYAAAHGLWMKGVAAFREAYHVPAIIRWPKHTRQAAREVGEFVEHVDFGPTLLEAAGLTSEVHLSGRSLLPFLHGETPTKWRDATHFQLNGVELYYTQRTVLTKTHKYVYNGFDFDELYDLRVDPDETRNLAFPDLSRKGREVTSGVGLTDPSAVPWPTIDAREDLVRRELLQRIWDFALDHNDTIFNPYGTVALAPYGPATGL